MQIACQALPQLALDCSMRACIRLAHSKVGQAGPPGREARKSRKWTSKLPRSRLGGSVATRRRRRQHDLREGVSEEYAAGPGRSANRRSPDVGAFLSLHRPMSGGHPVIGTSSAIAKPLLVFRRENGGAGRAQTAPKGAEAAF